MLLSSQCTIGLVFGIDIQRVRACLCTASGLVLKARLGWIGRDQCNPKGVECARRAFHNDARTRSKHCLAFGQKMGGMVHVRNANQLQ